MIHHSSSMLRGDPEIQFPPMVVPFLVSVGEKIKSYRLRKRLFIPWSTRSIDDDRGRGSRCIVLILLLFLSSCSVHRFHQYDKSINAKLAQVGITISSGKEPYLIKKSFQNEFYLGGEDHYKANLYELYVNVSNSVGDWLIQTDSTILRKSLTVDINYSLKDLKTSKLLTNGSARSLIIFSESPSAWSSYVSSEKAYENAVNDAMRSVRMQVALYLAGQPKDKNEHKAKGH